MKELKRQKKYHKSGQEPKDLRCPKCKSRDSFGIRDIRDNDEYRSFMKKLGPPPTKIFMEVTKNRRRVKA